MEGSKNCKKSIWTYNNNITFGSIFLCYSNVGKAFALLTVAMVVRLIVTFLVVSGNKLSIKDKIFVAIAWSPKATVQVRPPAYATIGWIWTIWLAFQRVLLYTVYCVFLSVFSLAKKLHFITEISATYRLVSYLPAIL